MRQRHSFRSWLLCLMLVSGTLLSACALQAANFAVEGMWSGKTDRGTTLTFEVKGDEIASFDVGLDIPNCPLLSMKGFGSGDKITGNAFTITVKDNQTFGTSYTLSGTFSSDTSASGTFDMEVKPSANFPSCNGTIKTAWNAQKQ